MFQFHFGTIDRLRQIKESPASTLFQFHFGTIDSTKSSDENSIVIEFQFHFGTIDRKGGCILQQEKKHVSIPLWYDW